MLQTEFVRNLNCNYERILLDVNPEEKRYQYCILSRGGIKGLLPPVSGILTVRLICIMIYLLSRISYSYVA